MEVENLGKDDGKNLQSTEFFTPTSLNYYETSLPPRTTEEEAIMEHLFIVKMSKEAVEADEVLKGQKVATFQHQSVAEGWLQVSHDPPSEAQIWSKMTHVRAGMEHHRHQNPIP